MSPSCPAVNHTPGRCICDSARARLDLHIAVLTAHRRPWWRAPTQEA